MRSLAAALVVVALFALTGCHCLIVVNVLGVNKTAAAYAAPFPDQAFCMSLLNPSVALKKDKRRRLELTIEQEHYCEELMEKTKETPTTKSESNSKSQ